MEFCFETEYTPNSMAVMAKALRKTVRKKRSWRSHIFGVLVCLLGAVLAFSASEINFKRIVTLLAITAIVLTLIFEDRLNGYIAYKRMLPGMDRSKVRFREDGYRSETPLGNSEFPYGTIRALAEHKDYFVFVFSRSHAQLYDKHSITGGSCEEFKYFLTEKTGLDFQAV